MVKFISYDGDYPNLCCGTLTLEIDGEIVKFGYSLVECDYYKFWSSGGSCGLRNGESYIEHDEWEFDDEEYFPDEYIKYYKEIKDLFNSNVPFGCCGGCI